MSRLRVGMHLQHVRGAHVGRTPHPTPPFTPRPCRVTCEPRPLLRCLQLGPLEQQCASLGAEVRELKQRHEQQLGELEAQHAAQVAQVRRVGLGGGCCCATFAFGFGGTQYKSPAKLGTAGWAHIPKLS